MSPFVHPQAAGTLGLSARHLAGTGTPQAAVPPAEPPAHRHESTEARLGARLALSLTQGSEALSPDITERLRFARESAVAHAGQQRRRAGVGAHRPTGQGTLKSALVRWASLWQGAAVLMPLVVLVLGLLMIARQIEQEEVHTLAEFDTVLLTDGLPPEAYSDPGFAEYLRSAPLP